MRRQSSLGLLLAAAWILPAAAEPPTAAAPVSVETDGTLSLHADGERLETLLRGLAAELGFAVEVAAGVRDLPVGLAVSGPPETVLAALLRPTNHVVVRDGDRVVRVFVLGVAPEGWQAAALPEEPVPVVGGGDPFAEERALIAAGKAPDTGTATGLSGALARTASMAERERQRAWTGIAAATVTDP